MVGLLILAGIVVLYIIAVFNALIRSKNRVDYAIGGVNTILKKRRDLIPNLIAIVKEYESFEKEIIYSLGNQSAHREDLLFADDDSTALLNSIFSKVEAYPGIKASNNFLQLQQLLCEVEEQLSAARRTYNANVLIFNSKLESIPSGIFARQMGYKKLPMFNDKLN